MRKNIWFIYCILLLGIFVALEANTFTTPAIPYIRTDFGISITNSGILTLLSSAGAIALSPLFGRLGDQIGRKKVVIAGLFIFVIAQSLKIVTDGVSLYLLGALLQGFGYALIFPNVFAYIPELFPEEKRGKAIGLFMVFTYIATATGGAISGLLIENWGWRSIYVVSAASSLIGLILISIFVPKSVAGQKSQLDYKGVTVFMTAISLFIALPLVYSNFGFMWLMVAIGGLFLLLFIFFQMQRREKNPTVDLKLLKNPGVHIPSILIAVQNFMMLSILMSLTFLAADNPNVSPLQVGLITTVLFTTAMLISPIIGVLLDRFNPIYLVYVALAFGFGGIILYFNIDITSSLLAILTVMGFVGVCSSLMNAALMKIVIGYTPMHQKGVGTGTFTLFKDLGPPLGSSLGLTIYGLSTSRGFETVVSETASDLGLNAAQTTELIDAKATGEVSSSLSTLLTQANVELSQLLSSATANSVAAGIKTLGIVNISLFILVSFLSLRLLKLRTVTKEVEPVQPNAVTEEIV